jgi:3-deoxy-manno-octulosonate cytidylyltransferase (CMP-KDO synthetase)
VSFTVLIPARMASTRLPDKPLADIAGVPMVVRVAQRATAAQARQVVVAADDARIVAACAAHGVRAVMTAATHPNGTSRLAEAASLLGLPDEELVVNVQGDEPLIEPALITETAAALARDDSCVMSTAAHALASTDELDSPHVVKVVLDRFGRALYFSRAPVPWWRDGRAAGQRVLSEPAPLRHIGIYAYRVGFLRQYPQLAPSPLEVLEALEQLRVLWHGLRIAVTVTAHVPGPGVDTPQDLARVRAAFATS